MRRKVNTYGAFVAITAYLGCMVLGFFHLLVMAEMSMPMEHCPFVKETQFFCPANVFVHTEILKGIVYFALPTVFIFLYSYFFVLTFIFANNSPPFLLRIRLYVLRKYNLGIYVLYQFLYSQGILNSKAY